MPEPAFEATNLATHLTTARVSSSAGLFNIAPLPPGTYSLKVLASGFRATAAFGSALTGWTQNGNAASTQLTTPNNFALVDNVQWLKGKHAFTFGLSYQWQQINNANPATYTGVCKWALHSLCL